MNEGVIKFGYVVAGLGTVTAVVRAPDDTTVREASVALTDSGHDSLYTNTGAISIQAGDTISIFIGSAFVTAEEYRPEASDVALRTTIASVVGVTDTIFVLTDGPAVAGIYKNAVALVTDVSGGISVPRRIAGYTAGKQVTLDLDIGFALQAGDIVRIYGNAYEGEIGSVALDQIIDGIWDELKNPHNTVGTMGRKQNQIKGGFYT